MLPDSSLPGFIQSLPKTETHLHVEGALPYELLHDLDPRRWPAQAPFRERSYRYSSFGDFEKQLLDNAMPWFTTAERYHEAAKLMFARHVEQNVKYVETSFHLPMTQFINVPGPVLIDAIRSAAPRGLEVRVFVGMIRTDINGAIRPVIDQLHTWEHLAGVDLHSHETLPTEPGTAEIWAKLRAAGKVTKTHAGEFTGAYRVREAIEQLGVTRIQHGTRAIEDPAVMRLCVERDVTFDMCPISNVGLKVVPAMAQHPLKKFMEAGIRCTLSTDDPLCFANTVNEEYLAVSHELGLTRKDLARLARNGFEVADLTPAQKQPWLAQLDAVIAGG